MRKPAAEAYLAAEAVGKACFTVARLGPLIDAACRLSDSRGMLFRDLRAVA
jgi:hypothetical protein